MDSRRLNRRVIIQQPAAAQDSLGQAGQGWSTLATVWGNVRTLTGVETVKAGAESSTVKASIRIRRRDAVTSAMRVLLGNTTYQVNAVLPDETDKQYMDLACEVIS